MSSRERIMAAEDALEIGAEPGITADITILYAKVFSFLARTSAPKNFHWLILM